MRFENRFVEYLFSVDRLEMYSMLNNDNITDFLDFYNKPVILYDDDGQAIMAELRSTLYQFDHGSCRKMPCSKIVPDRIGIINYTPVDLVWCDITSDAHWWGTATLWCEPDSIRYIDDFDLELETLDMIYSFRLHLYQEGFLKCSQTWERKEPIYHERIIIPGKSTECSL